MNEAGVLYYGQYKDEFTGLYYNYHRDYSHKMKRYLQIDPLYLKIRTNSYIYAENNLLNYSDFWGLDISIESTNALPQFSAIGLDHLNVGVVGGNRYSFGLYGFSFTANRIFTEILGKRTGTAFPSEKQKGDGLIYKDSEASTGIVDRLKTNKIMDNNVEKLFKVIEGFEGNYGLLSNTCRGFSFEMMDFFKNNKSKLEKKKYSSEEMLNIYDTYMEKNNYYYNNKEQVNKIHYLNGYGVQNEN